MPDGDDSVVVSGEHLDIPTNLLNDRCSDEDRWEWLVNTRYLKQRFETVFLTPERVPVHCRVDQSQIFDPIVLRIAGRDDEASTGCEQWLARIDMITEFGGDSFAMDEPRDGCRFAPGIESRSHSGTNPDWRI